MNERMKDDELNLCSEDIDSYIYMIVTIVVPTL